MIEHLKNFKGLINQSAKIEMKLDDKLQALLLFSSFPESWDTLLVTLSNSALVGKLTMDTVTNSLLNEEVRGKERGISSQSEANFVDKETFYRNLKPILLTTMAEVRTVGEIRDVTKSKGNLNLTIN